MDISRIKTCADRIAENEIALKWLREYGSGLTGRDDNAEVIVNIVYASNCPGSKEAAKVISSYAKLEMPKFVDTAIKSIENTIEMDRITIRDQVLSAEDC